MVDALVLEASTSVCGFESHLPHQKKRAPKGAFSFGAKAFGIAKCRPLRRGLPLRSMCGRNLRFPTHAPSLFVIPYSLRSKRTAPATGRGLEPGCAPGFFFAPNLRPRSSRSEPSRIKEGTRKGAFFWFVPPASPRQLFPNPCRRAAHQSSFLFPLHSPHSGLPAPLPGKPENRSPQGGGGSVPRQQCGTAKHPFPRTAPHAGHRLILNPCRRAALRNYSLFTILYSLSQPCSFFPPGRTAKQKYILFFGHLTHNSARYNIGLNLIMEGKEYGKTGSA